MSCIDHLSTLFLIYFFKHTIWNQLSTSIATVVDPVISDKGPLLLVLFFSLTHWYYYVVIYFQLAYFILSKICSNTISTGFVIIIAKKVSLFFAFDQNLFIRFDYFFLLEQDEVIVWVILTVYTHYFSSIFSNILFKTYSLMPLQPELLQL